MWALYLKQAKLRDQFMRYLRTFCRQIPQRLLVVEALLRVSGVRSGSWGIQISTKICKVIGHRLDLCVLTQRPILVDLSAFRYDFHAEAHDLDHAASKRECSERVHRSFEVLPTAANADIGSYRWQKLGKKFWRLRDGCVIAAFALIYFV